MSSCGGTAKNAPIQAPESILWFWYYGAPDPYAFSCIPDQQNQQKNATTNRKQQLNNVINSYINYIVTLLLITLINPPTISIMVGGSIRLLMLMGLGSRLMGLLPTHQIET